ncbi:MAG: protein TolR [Rheinheimera sp.]|jgi:biopolymer transport protein TolR|nr:protein TolR [Gammaproteobacteria bacterium]MDZ7902100.1 protein TolR [Rheinheimera sp.]
MYVRKKRRMVAEINVVPYIDVMLVLLIIFMVTTPIITQGVKVELPKSKAEPIEQMKDNKTPILATIDEAGLFYFQKDGVEKGPFNAEALQAEVMSTLTIEPGTQVIIKADGRVDYNSVIQLLNMMKDAGAPAVGLMTEDLEKK